MQNKDFSNQIIFNKRILSEKLGESLKDCGDLKAKNILKIINLFKCQFDIFSFYSSLKKKSFLIKTLKKNKKFKTKILKTNFIENLRGRTENYYKRLVAIGFINREKQYLYEDLLILVYNYYNRENYIDFLDDINYKFSDEIYNLGILYFYYDNEDRYKVPNYILNKNIYDYNIFTSAFVQFNHIETQNSIISFLKNNYNFQPYRNEIIKKAKNLLITRNMYQFRNNGEEHKIYKALSFNKRYNPTYSIFNIHYEISKLFIKHILKNKLHQEEEYVLLDIDHIIYDFIKNLYNEYRINDLDNLVIYHESNLKILDFLLKQFPLKDKTWNDIKKIIIHLDYHLLKHKNPSKSIMYLRDSINIVLCKYIKSNLLFIPYFKKRNAWYSRNYINFVYSKYKNEDWVKYIHFFLALIFMYTFIKIIEYILIYYIS